MKVVIQLLFIHMLLIQYVSSQHCRGSSKYELKIAMKWSTATDSDFDWRTMSVGGVVAVVHTESFKLFENGKNLTQDLKHMMQANKVGPTLERLDTLTKNGQEVHSFDYVPAAESTDTITLNLSRDGDKGANFVSFFGVLLGTPDYFFGHTTIRGQFKFIKEYPPIGEQAWVSGFDAGYDARVKIKPNTKRIPERKGVHSDERASLVLVERYATFKLTPSKLHACTKP